MKKISLSIFIFFMLISSHTRSQYRVMYDRPVLNGHYLSLGLVDMDFKSLATWNFRYETFLADGKFSISAEYANITNLDLLKKYAPEDYPDVLQDYDSIGALPIRSEKITPKKFEIGVTYNFHQRQKRAVRPIFLYSYAGGFNTDVNVYALRRITIYRFTGVRAGFGRMRTFFYGDVDPRHIAYYNVTTDPAPAADQDFFYATRFNQSYLYLGISRNSIFNVRISDLNGPGIRNRFTTAYLDLLLLAHSSYDDITDADTDQTYSLHTIDRSRLVRLGYRFGLRTQAVRYFGLGTIVEFGKFTGGSLLSEQVEDYWRYDPSVLRLVNYMRVGIYFSLTGPISQQNIRTRW